MASNHISKRKPIHASFTCFSRPLQTSFTLHLIVYVETLSLRTCKIGMVIVNIVEINKLTH
ncbi:CLUMA_CG021313, isoform A [Clunio marinus]|uniref:CLUMA_CG021313, isoform A n=1 Tax=Clunio marinus TaxID=568069 RepID=A0A1J1JC84_9DIPT|nr:CLUMA_CG021313, isoform A [Clunio marinus]